MLGEVIGRGGAFLCNTNASNFVSITDCCRNGLH